jgi:hypothetical protein
VCGKIRGLEKREENAENSEKEGKERVELFKRTG